MLFHIRDGCVPWICDGDRTTPHAHTPATISQGRHTIHLHLRTSWCPCRRDGRNTRLRCQCSHGSRCSRRHLRICEGLTHAKRRYVCTRSHILNRGHRHIATLRSRWISDCQRTWCRPKTTLEHCSCCNKLSHITYILDCL